MLCKSKATLPKSLIIQNAPSIFISVYFIIKNLFGHSGGSLLHLLSQNCSQIISCNSSSDLKYGENTTQKIEKPLTVFITQHFLENNQVSICYRFFPKQHPCQNQLSIHWKSTEHVQPVHPILDSPY